MKDGFDVQEDDQRDRRRVEEDVALPAEFAAKTKQLSVSKVFRLMAVMGRTMGLV